MSDNITNLPKAPRVWNEGDPEPMEIGLRLLDSNGDIWTQLEPMSWACNGDGAHAVSWDSPLNYAPLTEVSQ